MCLFSAKWPKLLRTANEHKGKCFESVRAPRRKFINLLLGLLMIVCLISLQWLSWRLRLKRSHFRGVESISWLIYRNFGKTFGSFLVNACLYALRTIYEMAKRQSVELLKSNEPSVTKSMDNCSFGGTFALNAFGKRFSWWRTKLRLLPGLSKRFWARSCKEPILFEVLQIHKPFWANAT